MYCIFACNIGIGVKAFNNILTNVQFSMRKKYNND